MLMMLCSSLSNSNTIGVTLPVIILVHRGHEEIPRDTRSALTGHRGPDDCAGDGGWRWRRATPNRWPWVDYAMRQFELA
jgi:hypothetical protein